MPKASAGGYTYEGECVLMQDHSVGLTCTLEAKDMEEGNNSPALSSSLFNQSSFQNWSSVLLSYSNVLSWTGLHSMGCTIYQRQTCHHSDTIVNVNNRQNVAISLLSNAPKYKQWSIREDR